MLRQICALLLVLTMAQAQESISPTSAQTPKNHEPLPKADLYVFYSDLRQGTSEEGFVSLSLPDKKIAIAGHPGLGIAPVVLELQTDNGIVFSDIRYPKGMKRYYAFTHDPVQIEPGGLEVRVKLHATTDAALGSHRAVGKIIYQTVSDSGFSEVQQIPVTASINVVTRHAKVTSEQSWPFHHMTARDVVLIVVLAPVLIPLGLVCRVAFNGCG